MGSCTTSQNAPQSILFAGYVLPFPEQTRLKTAFKRLIKHIDFYINIAAFVFGFTISGAETAPKQKRLYY